MGKHHKHHKHHDQFHVRTVRTRIATPHVGKNPIIFPPQFEGNDLVQFAIYAYPHYQSPVKCAYDRADPNFGHCKPKGAVFNFENQCNC